MHSGKKILILFLIILVSQQTLKTQIISYELVKHWTKEDISELYMEYSIPESTGEINYAVDGYKVLYFTPDFDGELVICSGAIFLPVEVGCSPPVISWQHGTISKKSAAPSNIGNTNNDLMGVLTASHGYIATMSDFIGLGEGEGLHNYVHADTEASATIDLIIYGKQFATEMLGIAPNDQLFLYGYSQGGHATMATVKEIEENYADQLEVTGSCPMAGPYDMSGAQRLMLEAGTPYPNPGYLPYVLFAYNKIYNLYDDIDNVLIPPYNNSLLDMYDGTNSMWTINYMLPEIPINIFWASYYQEYLNNEEHPFKIALAENDVYHFTPQSPMRLLHCSGDDNVTYANAEVAYNYFIESGAENIELIDGGDFNHSDCAFMAIIGAKIWIDSLAEICEPTNIKEELNNQNKQLITSIDFLGRRISPNKSNAHIINIYSDGTHQKTITIQ